MRINVLFGAVLLIAILPIVACGYGSGYNGGMNMTGAAPKITELVPNDILAGNPDFTMTVNGSGFGTGATVFWNGSPLTSSYITGNQITAAVPAANVATAAKISVYVRSGSQNSNMLTFTVQ